MFDVAFSLGFSSDFELGTLTASTYFVSKPFLFSYNE